MLRIVAAVAALAIGATAVYAQNLDAIKQRRDAMKNIAKAGTPPFQMMKGQAPFELAKVQAGLKAYQDEGAKLKTLFPAELEDGRRYRCVPEDLASQIRVRRGNRHVHCHCQGSGRQHQG